jgi:hypothetical protein
MDNEIVFAKLCVKRLGETVGSTREFGKGLGLTVDQTRHIWRKVLELTANGGGKIHDTIRKSA